MKIGYYQFNPMFGQVEANLEKVIQQLSGVEADLVVLPELFSTGYQFVSRQEALDLAEEIPGGKTSRALIELAREKKFHIVAGMAERAGDKAYNSAIFAGPKGYIGTYRKTHLFDKEKLWFDPGDTGFRVYDIGIARVGLMICFDWYFPESARTLALMGADIIAHPSNLVLPNCPDSMPVRCLENRVYAVTCNRIGTESRNVASLTYIGQSEIVTPKGAILHRAPTDQEELYIVEIDPLQARNKKVTELSDLFTDRRPETYELK